MTKKRSGPKSSSDMPDIIDLLLATGCRSGDVLALRWTDIDLAATPPTVAISGTIKTETGKGTCRKSKPKSDASKRTIRADAGHDWVTPHTFRKTVATRIDRLVDSDTAARVLGHSSSVITKEYYIEKDRSAPDLTHLLQSFADRNPAKRSTD